MSIVLLLVETIFIGIGLTWIFEFILKSNKKWRQMYYLRHRLSWGYHIHHSTYGLGLFLISAMMWQSDRDIAAIILSGIGIGIIMMHTISEGRFVFIEREIQNCTGGFSATFDSDLFF